MKRYRTTEAGRAAWESQDAAVPSDYRFILWMIEFHPDDYAPRLAALYPSELLRDWLGELADLGLVAPADGELAASDPDATLHLGPGARTAPPAALRAVAQSLESAGCYVAEERVAARAPLAKRAAQTELLVVEDDPDQLALADLRLALAGYRVRAADSVRALERSLAERGAPDLLLLDVMLPDGDGFEVLSQLRRHRAYASLPIVMLTARRHIADVERGFHLGADGYLTKPYSRDLLVTVVRRVLRQAPEPR